MQTRGAIKYHEYLFWKVRKSSTLYIFKIKTILKVNMDSIPSPSPLVNIQIMDGKVWLRYKGKTLLGDVSKLFVFKLLEEKFT